MVKPDREAGRRGERIRPLDRLDLPAVAELVLDQFVSVGPAAPKDRAKALAVLIEGYEDLFFASGLWTDADIGPRVTIDKEGRVAGFIGVVMRKMRFENREIRTANSFSFVVHPERATPMTSLKLLKAVLGGPQDLTLTDGANELSRKIWGALGGEEARLYGFEWRRILRPARHFMQVMRDRRPGIATVARLGLPAARLVDAGVLRAAPGLRPARPDALEAVEVEAEAFRRSAEACAADATLAPDFDAAQWGWQLQNAETCARHGPLRRVALREEDGAPAGGYAYLLRPQGDAHVLELHAGLRRGAEVLKHLFAQAWHDGATLAFGRLDPKMTRLLADQRAHFLAADVTLAHSRNREILNAILRGDARLGFLEGEASLLTHIYEAAARC